MKNLPYWTIKCVMRQEGDHVIRTINWWRSRCWIWAENDESADEANPMFMNSTRIIWLTIASFILSDLLCEEKTLACLEQWTYLKLPTAHMCPHRVLWSAMTSCAWMNWNLLTCLTNAWICLCRGCWTILWRNVLRPNMCFLTSVRKGIKLYITFWAEREIYHNDKSLTIKSVLPVPVGRQLYLCCMTDANPLEKLTCFELLETRVFSHTPRVPTVNVLQSGWTKTETYWSGYVKVPGHSCITLVLHDW